MLGVKGFRNRMGNERELKMARIVPFKRRFDYDNIVPHHEAEELRKFAVNIQSGGRLLTRFAIKIGKDLFRAKGYLDYGDFEDWCRLEAGLEPRMAQLYMMLAKFAVGDRAAVTGLVLSAAFKIAAPSTPDQVIETVIGRVKQGEKVSLNEIVALIQLTKNKEIVVHTEDAAASKIRALADEVRTALNPLLMEQLKHFFDNAAPALLQIFKTELNKKASG
jgi:hypothetical protein